MLTGFLFAATVVFVAEIGDKSLLLAMAFGARNRLAPVIAGITTASFISVGLAVSIGEGLRRVVGEQTVTLAASALFVVIGITLLLTRKRHEKPAAPKRFTSVYASVVVAFVLAEIGDKTMLMVITLAAGQPLVAVYAGAVVGMVAAATLGAVFAHRLAKTINPVMLARAAGVVFVVVGIALAAGAFTLPS